MLPLAFVGALFMLSSTDALVAVPLPGRTGWSFPRSNPDVQQREEDSQTIHASTSPAVIVRKTTKDDILQISSLLAAASAAGDDVGANNWNTKMQLLRDENTYRKQLSQRLDALEVGKKAAQKARAALVDDGLLEQVGNTDEDCNIAKDHTDHHTRLMWADDAFRRQLERAAAAIDTERHAWQGHNFAVPPNPSLLQHAMLSVVDANTHQIAGFCEVAMLPLPDDANGCSSCTPMITNLVTSPDYRRRGIATKLLKSARRYVDCCWGSGDGMSLGLYVESYNAGAKSLYLREGFIEKGHCSQKPTRLYLSLQL